ncbi:hypothetical protein EVAR_5522_1 [Eumeta japonica]|uniref:Uncharacterized protein n=1 Tax=Eumeta variegata TaxID=151549 RepID=A0A4C1TA01_EUMVA|nr:hypothetical protein EVAR_5522_1 [Eumeta japonica]
MLKAKCNAKRNAYAPHCFVRRRIDLKRQSKEDGLSFSYAELFVPREGRGRRRQRPDGRPRPPAYLISTRRPLISSGSSYDAVTLLLHNRYVSAMNERFLGSDCIVIKTRRRVTRRLRIQASASHPYIIIACHSFSQPCDWLMDGCDVRRCVGFYTAEEKLLDYIDERFTCNSKSQKRGERKSESRLVLFVPCDFQNKRGVSFIRMNLRMTSMSNVLAAGAHVRALDRRGSARAVEHQGPLSSQRCRRPVGRVTCSSRRGANSFELIWANKTRQWERGHESNCPTSRHGGHASTLGWQRPRGPTVARAPPVRTASSDLIRMFSRRAAARCGIRSGRNVQRPCIAVSSPPKQPNCIRNVCNPVFVLFHAFHPLAERSNGKLGPRVSHLRRVRLCANLGMPVAHAATVGSDYARRAERRVTARDSKDAGVSAAGPNAEVVNRCKDLVCARWRDAGAALPSSARAARLRPLYLTAESEHDRLSISRRRYRFSFPAPAPGRVHLIGTHVLMFRTTAAAAQGRPVSGRAANRVRGEPVITAHHTSCELLARFVTFASYYPISCYVIEEKKTVIMKDVLEKKKV